MVPRHAGLRQILALDPRPSPRDSPSICGLNSFNSQLSLVESTVTLVAVRWGR